MANLGSGSGRNQDDGDVVKALIESNNHMGKEMEYLKNRLNALEMQQQSGNVLAPSTGKRNVGGDGVSDKAVISNAAQAATANANNNVGGRKGIKWMDSTDAMIDPSASAPVAADTDNAPPMRKIKFRDLSPQNEDDIEGGNNANDSNNIKSQGGELVDNDDENDNDSSESSCSSSDSEAIAFSGWARCFFQARHHRSATQITSGATSTTSQDTYLHLTILSTDNELRISNTDDRWKPPLIDPPIPLKYFYASKVPGSHSGAALFLKNDSRRLRKYIFRFEFINRAVHQPPQRYVQFARSGKAAKRSMRGINKVKKAFNKMGEEKKENIKENKKRAQDAFAAHLGTLDELLRESDESAERFVECVNTRNEEEEMLARSSQRESMMGSSSGVMGDSAMAARRSGGNKRSKPPPPYWGSGFNRPSTNENSDDDEVDSDEGSDVSEEEDELYYDDDNDDETFFDKVQVSTEQTLETLFNHIVK